MRLKLSSALLALAIFPSQAETPVYRHLRGESFAPLAVDANGAPSAHSMSLSYAPAGTRVNAPSSTPPALTGGKAPYSWAMSPDSPPLPTGLILDPSGAILGRARAASELAGYKVTVTDATGASQTSPPFSLNVTPGVFVNTPSGNPLVTFRANGVAGYSATAGNVLGTATWSEKDPTGGGASYPAWLSVSSGGVISASSASAQAPVQASVTATDVDGSYATAPFRVQVLGALAFSTQPANASEYVGNPVGITTGLSNRLGPVGYELLRNGATAPDALAACQGPSLSQVTGVISGNAGATCDVQNLSIRATDADGTSVTSNPFSVQVVPVVLTAATVRPSRLLFSNTSYQISGASLSDFYDRVDQQMIAGYRSGPPVDMATMRFDTPVLVDRCHFSVYVPQTAGTKLTVYMIDEKGAYYFNIEGYTLTGGWNVYDGPCGFDRSGPKLVKEIMLSRENSSGISIYTGEFRVGYKGVDAK